MMKSIKIIFYLSMINGSVSYAGGLSKKHTQSETNTNILKRFFQHDAAKDILLEVMQEHAQTPLIEKNIPCF